MSTQLTAPLGGYNPYDRSVCVVASTTNPTVAHDENGQPFLESLVGWDLERFCKNPVILWNHEACGFPVGKATEFEVTPDGGLKMKITLVHPGVSDIADQIAGLLQDDILRAVSVGFEPGAATKNVDGTWTKTNNVLLELSFVTIPADEDAGTPQLNPEAAEADSLRTKVSAAASELARHRARARKATAEAAAKALEDSVNTDAAATVAKQKKAARKQVELAIARGDITRGTCEAPGCKSAETEAHHTNYEKPLELKWLCKEHHEEEHHDMTDVQRFDVGGRLHRAKRTSLGGAYINARISRTGVLRYVLPNGTTRRELRHPDEVFKTDSLATLSDVPVIDIRDHTAILSPDDYRRASLGHVKSYRHDSKFIESELVVQDQATLDAIDSGERTEISCGYVCQLDFTPGTFDGEPYDCVQRNIRYNHVALCPPNRGRAGPEVGLRLDANSDARWGVTNITDGEIPMTIKVRLDGTDFEVGSESHIAKLDAMSKAAVEKATADATSAAQVKLDAAEAAKAAVTKERDEAQGKLDAATTELATVKLDATKAKKDFDASIFEKEKSMRARMKSAMRILRFFGQDEEEDEDKMDARLDSILADGGERTAMVEAITKTQPTFDAKDKSDDYVLSRFDSLLESKKADKGIDGVARAALLAANKLDSTDTSHLDAVVRARAARDKAAADAHKLPAA